MESARALDFAAKIDAFARSLDIAEQAVLVELLIGRESDDVAGFGASNWPGLMNVLGPGTRRLMEAELGNDELMESTLGSDELMEADMGTDEFQRRRG